MADFVQLVSCGDVLNCTAANILKDASDYFYAFSSFIHFNSKNVLSYFNLKCFNIDFEYNEAVKKSGLYSTLIF